MSTMDALIGQQNTVIRLIENAEANFRKIGQAKRTPAVIKHRIKILDEYWARCQALQAKMEASATEEDLDETYFKDDVFQTAEDAYNNASDYMITELDLVMPAAPPPQPGPEINVINAPRQPFNPVKLPRIELPKFSGKYTDVD